MPQPGIAQASEQAPVTPIADLLIEQQGEPFGMGEHGGFSGYFDLIEGLGHAVESELMKQIEPLDRYLSLELFEPRRIAQTRTIDKNCGARIAIRIYVHLVHASGVQPLR